MQVMLGKLVGEGRLTTTNDHRGWAVETFDLRI